MSVNEKQMDAAVGVDGVSVQLCIAFNHLFTYHVASPPGSEQERLEYALSSKRRALILTLRWANAHTYLLQEESAAMSFLEASFQMQ